MLFDWAETLMGQAGAGGRKGYIILFINMNKISSMHIDILNKCILLMTLCYISDKIPILRSYFTLKNSIEAVQAKIFKVFILCFCHHYSQIAISSAINFGRHYSSFKTAAEMAGQNCKILCAIFYGNTKVLQWQSLNSFNS